MDILETDAYDRRQRRNTVRKWHFLSLTALITAQYSKYLSMVLLKLSPCMMKKLSKIMIHRAASWKCVLCHVSLFLSLPPSLSVLHSLFFPLAFFFVHRSVLLPVDSWHPLIHHKCRSQISTSAPIGCSSAELERRSKCPGCGGRTGFLGCRWLLPGVAWAVPAW